MQNKLNYCRYTVALRLTDGKAQEEVTIELVEDWRREYTDNCQIEYNR